MLRIETVQPTSPSSVVESARNLLRLYHQFLESSGSCGTHLPHLEDEVATLPATYISHGGEVLLALVDDVPAACVAYRSSKEDAVTCEIKRLFVHPSFRGQGIARKLLMEVFARARSRNFIRAVLDTDTTTMQTAQALYIDVGFREYRREGNVACYELAL